MKLKNIKVLAVSLVALGAAGALASCGSETGTTIVVWAPTEEQAVIDEVVKEYKHHNHRISTFKWVKSVSGLVPIFKLFVKGFD